MHLHLFKLSWGKAVHQHGGPPPQEHFKECEKEAKLKPFAKAALAAKNERVDPVAHAKEEAQRWLRDSVNILAEQVEGFEVSLLRCPFLASTSLL